MGCTLSNNVRAAADEPTVVPSQPSQQRSSSQPVLKIPNKPLLQNSTEKFSPLFSTFTLSQDYVIACIPSKEKKKVSFLVSNLYSEYYKYRHLLKESETMDDFYVNLKAAIMHKQFFLLKPEKQKNINVTFVGSNLNMSLELDPHPFSHGCSRISRHLFRSVNKLSNQVQLCSPYIKKEHTPENPCDIHINVTHPETTPKQDNSEFSIPRIDSSALSSIELPETFLISPTSSFRSSLMSPLHTHRSTSSIDLGTPSKIDVAFAFSQFGSAKQLTSLVSAPGSIGSPVLLSKEAESEVLSFWAQDSNSSGAPNFSEVLTALMCLKRFFGKDRENNKEQIQQLQVISDHLLNKSKLNDAPPVDQAKTAQNIKKLVTAVKTSGMLKRIIAKKASVIPPEEEELKDLLSQVESWEFDMFKLTAATHERPLSSIVLFGFEKYDLFNSLNIERPAMVSYLRHIEAEYGRNPYHCCIHAADVVQVILFLLGPNGLHKILSKEEIFALILGAAVHDFRHPGLTNAYLIKLRHKLALKYNDRSVLESFHISSAFKEMQLPQYNVMKSFSSEQLSSVRDIMIDLVLATDLSQHHIILQKFEAIVNGNAGQFNNPKDKKTLLQMCIKFADISNCSRGLSMYLPWVRRIQEEFFLQGDLERTHMESQDEKLKTQFKEISPFCDRNSCNLNKCQIGFINYIALPAYKVFSSYFKDLESVIVRQAQNNLEFWNSTPVLESIAKLDELIKSHYEKVGFSANALHLGKVVSSEATPLLGRTSSHTTLLSLAQEAAKMVPLKEGA